MPDYAYKAATADGKILKGSRFANNEQELRARIKDHGMHLLEFREAKALEFLKILEGIQLGGLNRSQLIEFSNNLGVMIKAGVPLLNGLDEIREDAENKYIKNMLTEIIENIQAGDSLSDAMGRRKRDFPALYVNVVEIGEQTGSLDSVFFDLARHFKRIDDLVRNVRKAMLYPAFVLFALMLASFVFLTMVFPPLFTLLKEFDVPLPLVTRVVMGVSSFLNDNWPFLLGGGILFIFLYLSLRKIDRFKYYMDWVELRIPYFRTLFIQLRIAFFLRYLSMLLTAGMDILRGLSLSISSVNNLVIREAFTQAREQVIEGAFFSEAIRRYRFIPNMVVRMIAIGEESGNLPEQMEYVADHYNEELERRISAAIALLEPVLLFALAALALTLVMGVLLPIYNLVTQLSTQAGAGGF